MHENEATSTRMRFQINTVFKSLCFRPSTRQRSVFESLRFRKSPLSNPFSKVSVFGENGGSVRFLQKWKNRLISTSETAYGKFRKRMKLKLCILYLFDNTIWCPESYSMYSSSFILFRNIHGYFLRLKFALVSTFQETVGSLLKRYLKSFQYIMFCEKKIWLFPFLDSSKHGHSRRQPGRIFARLSFSFSISQPTKLFHKVCITRCSMSLWLYPLFWVFSLILF